MTRNSLLFSRKTLIAATLAVLMTAGATGAFAWGGGPREPGQRFEYIFSQLNLTEEQSTQVLEVMQGFAESRHEAMKARRDAGEERPTAEEREALREDARTALADELGTVLQANQVEELMTYLEFHGPKMGGGRHHGRHGRNGSVESQ